MQPNRCWEDIEVMLCVSKGSHVGECFDEFMSLSGYSCRVWCAAEHHQLPIINCSLVKQRPATHLKETLSPNLIKLYQPCRNNHYLFYSFFHSCLCCYILLLSKKIKTGGGGLAICRSLEVSLRDCHPVSCQEDEQQ